MLLQLVPVPWSVATWSRSQQELTSQEGLIIDTGGGVIERQEHCV